MKTFKEWLKIKEAEAIVTSCKPTADYQVAGACSDLKKKKKPSGIKEAIAVGPVKGGADFQVRGTGSAGMKKMGAFGFNVKKMSGFGNPGGIAVPKGEK